MHNTREERECTRGKRGRRGQCRQLQAATHTLASHRRQLAGPSRRQPPLLLFTLLLCLLATLSSATLPFTLAARTSSPSSVASHPRFLPLSSSSPSPTSQLRPVEAALCGGGCNNHGRCEGLFERGQENQEGVEESFVLVHTRCVCESGWTSFGSLLSPTPGQPDFTGGCALHLWTIVALQAAWGLLSLCALFFACYKLVQSVRVIRVNFTKKLLKAQEDRLNPTLHTVGPGMELSVNRGGGIMTERRHMRDNSRSMLWQNGQLSLHSPAAGANGGGDAMAGLSSHRSRARHHHKPSFVMAALQKEKDAAAAAARKPSAAKSSKGVADSALLSLNGTNQTNPLPSGPALPQQEDGVDFAAVLRALHVDAKAESPVPGPRGTAAPPPPPATNSPSRGQLSRRMQTTTHTSFGTLTALTGGMPLGLEVSLSPRLRTHNRSGEMSPGRLRPSPRSPHPSAAGSDTPSSDDIESSRSEEEGPEHRRGRSLPRERRIHSHDSDSPRQRPYPSPSPLSTSLNALFSSSIAEGPEGPSPTEGTNNEVTLLLPSNRAMQTPVQVEPTTSVAIQHIQTHSPLASAQVLPTSADLSPDDKVEQTPKLSPAPQALIELSSFPPPPPPPPSLPAPPSVASTTNVSPLPSSRGSPRFALHADSTHASAPSRVRMLSFHRTGGGAAGATEGRASNAPGTSPNSNMQRRIQLRNSPRTQQRSSFISVQTGAGSSSPASSSQSNSYPSSAVATPQHEQLPSLPFPDMRRAGSVEDDKALFDADKIDPPAPLERMPSVPEHMQQSIEMGDTSAPSTHAQAQEEQSESYSTPMLSPSPHVLAVSHRLLKLEVSSPSQWQPAPEAASSTTPLTLSRHTSEEVGPNAHPPTLSPPDVSSPPMGTITFAANLSLHSRRNSSPGASVRHSHPHTPLLTHARTDSTPTSSKRRSISPAPAAAVNTGGGANQANGATTTTTGGPPLHPRRASFGAGNGCHGGGGGLLPTSSTMHSLSVPRSTDNSPLIRCRPLHLQSDLLQQVPSPAVVPRSAPLDGSDDFVRSSHLLLGEPALPPEPHSASSAVSVVRGTLMRAANGETTPTRTHRANMGSGGGGGGGSSGGGSTPNFHRARRISSGGGMQHSPGQGLKLPSPPSTHRLFNGGVQPSARANALPSSSLFSSTVRSSHSPSQRLSHPELNMPLNIPDKPAFILGLHSQRRDRRRPTPGCTNSERNALNSLERSKKAGGAGGAGGVEPALPINEHAALTLKPPSLFNPQVMSECVRHISFQYSVGAVAICAVQVAHVLYQLYYELLQDGFESEDVFPPAYTSSSPSPSSSSRPVVGTDLFLTTSFALSLALFTCISHLFFNSHLKLAYSMGGLRGVAAAGRTPAAQKRRIQAGARGGAQATAGNFTRTPSHLPRNNNLLFQHLSQECESRYIKRYLTGHCLFSAGVALLLCAVPLHPAYLKELCMVSFLGVAIAIAHLSFFATIFSISLQALLGAGTSTLNGKQLAERKSVLYRLRVLLWTNRVSGLLAFSLMLLLSFVSEVRHASSYLLPFFQMCITLLIVSRLWSLNWKVKSAPRTPPSINRAVNGGAAGVASSSGLPLHELPRHTSGFVRASSGDDPTVSVDRFQCLSSFKFTGVLPASVRELASQGWVRDRAAPSFTGEGLASFKTSRLPAEVPEMKEVRRGSISDVSPDSHSSEH